MLLNIATFLCLPYYRSPKSSPVETIKEAGELWMFKVAIELTTAVGGGLRSRGPLLNCSLPPPPPFRPACRPIFIMSTILHDPTPKLN
jgi:hypothetical protein